MFRKHLIISIALLLFASVFDFLSLSSSKENSVSKLRAHVQELLEETVNEINDVQFQKAIGTNNGSLQDLKLLEEYIDRFEENNISIRIRRQGKQLFWTSQEDYKDVCLDTIVNGNTTNICLNLFDAQGEIHSELSSKFGSFHKMSLDENGKFVLDVKSGRLKLTLGEIIRSAWLIGIILSIYLLGLILLFSSIKTSFGIVMLPLIFFRVFIYLISLESHFSPLKLFDESYGFSFLNESIAAYLLNTIILFIASILFAKTIMKEDSRFRSLKESETLLLFLSSLLLTIFFIYNAKNLIYFSQLNFDFEDLSKLKFLEQLSLAALTLNGLSLFAYNQGVFNIITNKYPALLKRYVIYGVGALIAGGFAQLLGLEISFLWIFPFLLVLIVLFDLFSDMKSKNISWLIWWMIVFSILIAAVLYHFDMRQDISERKEFLKSAYHLPDPAQAALFNSEFESIVNEGQLQQIINKPVNDKFNTQDIIEFIKDKRPLLANTRLEIKAYDDTGKPLTIDLYDNKESFYEKHQHDLELSEHWTFDPINNTYWVLQTVSNPEHNLLIYFGFSPNEEFSGTEYPVSYIKNGITVLDQNNLDLEELKLIKSTAQNRELVFNGAQAYILFRPTDSSILSSKKIFASILKPIALFSYVFGILGFVLLMVSLLNGYFSFLPESIPLKFWDINSFSIRIQLVIIMLIILSFMGIAWVTVRFIDDFIQNNENQLIESKITAVSKNMNVVAREELDFNTAMQVLIGRKNQMESIHQSNIEFYSKEGGSYDNPVLGSKLDYLPYYYFNKLNGKFPFTIRYSSKEPKSYFIFNHLGLNESVVGIGSNAELKANKLSLFDFLGSIVNVYVFLFLIAGAISIAVARSISKPLSVLAEKMQQLKLGSKNEPLEWKSKDEIGALISNYNAMVQQLEDSAEVLAKTERDMAWREMAKQVAHEIKNPLTPMKLSIQYLEKAMKSPNEDLKPLIKRISETLLLQINNLAEIADSFSNFAQLPQANNEKISLNEVVETIHDLFRKRDDIEIKLIEPIDSVLVHADKNHLVRILNNLVKNAIEAIPQSREGDITIHLSKDNKNAIIRVSDNGTGIPKHLHKKVFTPNFTTKNSGSGLGLAIASNMLDAFNARIYFETVEDEGTDFFIEIPLIRSSPILKEKDRIGLDE